MVKNKKPNVPHGTITTHGTNTKDTKKIHACAEETTHHATQLSPVGDGMFEPYPVKRSQIRRLSPPASTSAAAVAAAAASAAPRAAPPPPPLSVSLEPFRPSSAVLSFCCARPAPPLVSGPPAAPSRSTRTSSPSLHRAPPARAPPSPSPAAGFAATVAAAAVAPWSFGFTGRCRRLCWCWWCRCRCSCSVSGSSRARDAQFLSEVLFIVVACVVGFGLFWFCVGRGASLRPVSGGVNNIVVVCCWFCFVLGFVLAAELVRAAPKIFVVSVSVSTKQGKAQHPLNCSGRAGPRTPDASSRGRQAEGKQ